MKYYVIAGEPSGDLHGSKLMRGICHNDPEASFRFSGGDRMAEVGGAENMLYHYKDMSFFGFVQVAKNLRTIFRQIDDVKADIERFSPDVIILIDYPAFNLRIAKWAIFSVKRDASFAAESVSRKLSQRLPHTLAKSTFLARPTVNLLIPLPISTTSVERQAISSLTSL